MLSFIVSGQIINVNSSSHNVADHTNETKSHHHPTDHADCVPSILGKITLYYSGIQSYG